ncbi:hypothetical protein DL95DRAFT_233002, partial [Leptodontidium sp. 2 PMI_412]
GFKEFMFWGAFSYDKKGPCHIWKSETAAEARAGVIDINARNAAREATDKAVWEAKELKRQEDFFIKHKRRRRPVWRHTEKNGAHVVKK